MKRSSARMALITALAFGAGIAVAHAPQGARAAAAPWQAAVIDLNALQPSDLQTPAPTNPNVRSKPLAVADGATVQVQIGTVGKHFHADANEVQIVMSGTGTEWLGDKQVALKPGMMLIIPAGTPHGGTIDPSLKLVAFKTPPQAAADIHPLP